MAKVPSSVIKAAADVVSKKTTVNSIAHTVKQVGLDVMDGVRGNYRGYTKRLGEQVLKSNMSEAQLKDAAKNGMSRYMKNAKSKGLIENTIKGKIGEGATKAVEDKVKKAGTKVAKKARAEWGTSAADMMLGTVHAKGNKAFMIGDAIGGGVRDTMRSLKHNKDIGTALKAGFTHKVDGETKVRMGRVAGAAFGASVAGRVATGGGLYRDRYGRVNVPGVPFI